MRVVMNLEQLLTPSPGGIGRYAARLSAHLGRLGVDVQPVVARHRQAEVRQAWSEQGVDGVPLPRLLALPRPLLYDAWHLAGWPPVVKRGDGTDLVHAPSLAVPPKGGAPLVVTVHDAGPWLYPEAYSARGRWFHRAGARAALRRADLVLTGTQASAQELCELAGVPAALCRVIPYGVDLFEVPNNEDNTATLSRWGLQGKTYVLWLGTLEPRKGVGTLVAAMARLAELGRVPAELVLAGFPGWRNQNLVDNNDIATLGGSLHRVGRVDEAELRALYAGAALFAFPSTHEGFGLPVLEAMSAGTPVVASDIAPLREVTGGAAKLVAPGDVEAWAEAIASLLANEDGRSALATAGRQRAARLSWAATAELTLAAYRQLVG